ncbi:MAG TPA: hypothetical protein DEB40_00130 [Elusimicrobia bacterium]|nr:hypothetical protein [Elusimicrobiota bacterium]HBT60140.1 hypothetical protein [Elusimicrobiota bacterium]
MSGEPLSASNLGAWRCAAMALCAAVLAANVWHLLVQTAPPAWDDAWYLEVSFRLYQALKAGLMNFLQSYAHAFRIKAPLIAVLPLPLYAVFGTGERIALWVNMLALPLTWLFAFRIGRLFYGERAGLAAAMACALLPLSYGLSRFFYVECVLTAFVTWSVWEILRVRADDRWAGARLGALLGLGLLAKSSFLLYVIGPIWLRREALRPHAKTALVCGGLLASTWYAWNLPFVAGFGLSAGFGSISHSYGSHALSYAALRGFAVQVVFQALSWPYALVAVVLLAAAWQSRPRPWNWGDREWFLLFWLGLPFLCVALAVNKQVRYLAPILPALAVAVGAAAAAVASGTLRTAMAALLTLAPAAVFCGQTFGIPESRPMFFNGPPSRDPGWDRRAVVETLVAKAPEGAVVAIGFEHALFNANNLASLSFALGHRYEFVNLVQGNNTVEDALIRLKDKSAAYLIMVQGELPAEVGTPHDFLNRANAGIQARLGDGRLKATRLDAIPVSHKVSAVLYKLGVGRGDEE